MRAMNSRGKFIFGCAIFFVSIGGVLIVRYGESFIARSAGIIFVLLSVSMMNKARSLR